MDSSQKKLQRLIIIQLDSIQLDFDNIRNLQFQ